MSLYNDSTNPTTTYQVTNKNVWDLYTAICMTKHWRKKYHKQVTPHVQKASTIHTDTHTKRQDPVPRKNESYRA
jgi:hypothetical protein